jgi:hypothetical protein
VAGAAKSSPHGLIQEFLNRAEGHLWGFLANGLSLRILRDNKSLTRQAYVEFDLAAMMDGQVYADFALLWLLCHQSRVEADRPEHCWLEKWAEAARAQGTRALDQLRDGVEKAIAALGRGFLAHPANKALLQKLRAGALGKQDYYRELLRAVYRLIFLFVAEDRDLLLADGSREEGSREIGTEKAGGGEIGSREVGKDGARPSASIPTGDSLPPTPALARARDRYMRYYSMDRLRALAERRRGSPHADLWDGLSLVFRKLSSDTGCPELGLPALGSFLWSDKATPDLDACELANTDLLDAIRSLAFTVDGGVRRAIDYKNLGPEELGSVYESLLELHPEVNADASAFDLTIAAGHERKTTGSYYTPTSLIECLLDSALDPVIEERLKEAARLARTGVAGRETAGREIGSSQVGSREKRTAGSIPTGDSLPPYSLPPDPRPPYSLLASHALLSLKVCDPACGSGHFLIAAAHRIANQVAAVRTGDEEPSPEAIRTALRDVIGRCLYGVDVNPMAVELCKVNLWLEALEPGKPLSFLEHHIQCGNSLLGATPALLRKGIPDEVFEPLVGDDKDYCRKYKKENRKEREGQGSLFQPSLEPWNRLGDLATALADLDAIKDDTLEGQRDKQERWERLVRSQGYEFGRLLADAWCAAFVFKKAKDPALPYPITEEVFRRIEKNPHSAPPWMAKEIRRLADEYQFFHWHLAFPDVFRVPGSGEEPPPNGQGWFGGFDLVLGNPPWERIKLQEKEFFAERRPDIANAPNAAARRKMIKALETEDPPLFQAFQAALRRADGESVLVRDTGRYPLCGRGDINTYAIFAELNRSLIGPHGRVGCIVPSGIATDDTTRFFFQDIVEKQCLVSLFDFENRQGLFPAVDSRMKFCLVTLSGPAATTKASEFLFFVHTVADLADSERRFTLASEDFALLNPNTRTCPIFRTRRDADLTKTIYRRVPVLVGESKGDAGNPWAVSFLAMLHMANDSGVFRTAEQLKADGWTIHGNIFQRDEDRYLPLYEAKMVHHFNHRFGDYGAKPEDSESTALPDVPDTLLADPSYVPLPRYWVPAAAVEERLQSRCDRDWLLGWRDICRSTDERTVIASIIPRTGVGHTMPLFIAPQAPKAQACLVANLCSFTLDYVARQKVGGTHLTYIYLKQLPILPPVAYEGPAPWAPGLTTKDFIQPRVLELAYSAWDLQPFAGDLGRDGSPFRWDRDRALKLRCELDAAFFHLYRIGREDVDYIMETFPIVRRNDEKQYGPYRTKDLILEIYDRMQKAMEGGEPYQTILDPPPADPRLAPQG